MEAAVKVLVFVIVSLLLIVGLVILSNDNFAQKLKGVFGQGNQRQNAGGQQLGGQDGSGQGTGGDGDGTTIGSDGSTGGGQGGGGSTGGGGAPINSQFGYIFSYDTLGQSPSQTDLSPTFISTEYNWINQNTANIILGITIENSGEQTTSTHVVEIKFNNVVQEVVVPAMPALSFYVAQASYDNVNSGNHNLVVIVDKNNEITESNEDNNRVEQEVFV